jgi:hypothetical protein
MTLTGGHVPWVSAHSRQGGLAERIAQDVHGRALELELAGAKADQHIPGMRAHLEGCPACHEDHESLLAFVARQRTAAD